MGKKVVFLGVRFWVLGFRRDGSKKQDGRPVWVARRGIIGILIESQQG